MAFFDELELEPPAARIRLTLQRFAIALADRKMRIAFVAIDFNQHASRLDERGDAIDMSIGFRFFRVARESTSHATTA